MLFLDGVGIGKPDYEFNPFFKYGFNTFTELFGEIPHSKNEHLSKDHRFVFPVDASMGVEGIPQSGTGQTSIFSGVNGPEILGWHFGPYAHKSLLPAIHNKNIFKIALESGKSVHFANAYPKPFFKYLKSGAKRLNVTAHCVISSGMKFNKADDVRKGRALTAEISSEKWNSKLGYKLPILTPEKAARNLLNTAAKFDLTVFEYFYTDYAGHFRFDGNYGDFTSFLDRFLFTILSELNLETQTILICSDHGNFEDLSMKQHTYNSAIGISAGKHAKYLKENIKFLYDIKDSVLNVLNF